ncbi:hypothetical protein CFOL_v3_15523 [Cephalotus follicularis]|uniref:Uncharacterized protein n=1 Tax=Cephalotus follicularis TaxID=3775 RepID=A0A1Q3BVI4_CEPFO|nr:hypothetical protein CFOL_v3_15523 [Cephalotus follicularis]
MFPSNTLAKKSKWSPIMGAFLETAHDGGLAPTPLKNDRDRTNIYAIVYPSIIRATAVTSPRFSSLDESSQVGIVSRYNSWTSGNPPVTHTRHAPSAATSLALAVARDSDA